METQILAAFVANALAALATIGAVFWRLGRFEAIVDRLVDDSETATKWIHNRADACVRHDERLADHDRRIKRLEE
jgi:hypothetical protein